MTPYTKSETIWPSNISEILDSNFAPRLRQQTMHGFKPNMIGICMVSFVLGLLLKSIGPEKSKMIRHLLGELETLVGASFDFLLKIMPAGMFFWMFSEALKMSSITSVAMQLIHFYTLLSVAFAFLWLVFYPTIYFLFTRKNAFRLYQSLIPAILVAFASISSVITLPVTMQCMDNRSKKKKMSKAIANSVLPLGATIHMNGAAIYYPMVALFVAQMKGVQVDPFLLFVLW